MSQGINPALSYLSSLILPNSGSTSTTSTNYSSSSYNTNTSGTNTSGSTDSYYNPYGNTGNTGYYQNPYYNNYYQQQNPYYNNYYQQQQNPWSMSSLTTMIQSILAQLLPNYINPTNPTTPTTPTTPTYPTNPSTSDQELQTIIDDIRDEMNNSTYDIDILGSVYNLSSAEKEKLEDLDFDKFEDLYEELITDNNITFDFPNDREITINDFIKLYDNLKYIDANYDETDDPFDFTQISSSFSIKEFNNYFSTIDRIDEDVISDKVTDLWQEMKDTYNANLLTNVEDLSERDKGRLLQIEFDEFESLMTSAAAAPHNLAFDPVSGSNYDFELTVEEFLDMYDNLKVLQDNSDFPDIDFSQFNNFTAQKFISYMEVTKPFYL